jgi:hypothetical protein
MEERSLKRLLIILGVSIVIILLLKMMLLKTATQVHAVKGQKALAEKSRAAPPATPAPAPASGPE